MTGTAKMILGSMSIGVAIGVLADTTTEGVVAATFMAIGLWTIGAVDAASPTEDAQTKEPRHE